MGIFDFLGKAKKTSNHIPIAKATVYMREATPEDIRQQVYDETAKIRELRENSIPSKRGLCPHEILMLYYAPKYSVKQTEFPQFWYYKYAVDNPRALLEKLRRSGFIRIATAKESLDKLTTRELKEILSENDLKTTGKKVDLIKSISTNVSDECVENLVLDRSYAITEIGDSELKDNEYVPYLHKCKYSVSIWDINKLMDGYPPALWRDRIWSELNRLYLEASKQTAYGNWGPCDAIRHQQIDFLIEESKFQSALELAVEVTYNEIVHEAVSRFKIEIELRENGIKSTPMPTFAEIIKTGFDFNISKLKTIFSETGTTEGFPISKISMAFDRFSLKSRILSKEDFIAMIESRLSGNDDRFVEICNKAQRCIVKGG